MNHGAVFGHDGIDEMQIAGGALKSGSVRPVTISTTIPRARAAAMPARTAGSSTSP